MQHFKNLLSLFIFSFFFAACTDLSDVENDISDLKENVAELQTAIADLQRAYNDGKIIKSVESFSDEKDNGWIIRFSDETFIKILNGTDGLNGSTPYLQVNSEGIWIVSYDNGDTFTYILDSDGNAVLATGEKGNEGISVRVIENENGVYEYQLYYASSPGEIIDRVVTPFSVNKANAISSISQDDQTHIITLVMADGSIFSFNLDVAYANSIVLLSTNLPIGYRSISTFEFRINPSNAVFNYDVENGNCQIELDKVGNTRAVANSYVTNPVNYELIKIEPSVNEVGEVKEGQYKAYVKDLGLSSTYKELATVVLSTKDGNGKSIQISSSVFEIYFNSTDGNAFTAFHFEIGSNPGKILNNTNTSNIEDGLVDACVPYLTDFSNLVPSFATNGDKVYVNGVEQISGVTANDFSAPVSYQIISSQGVEQMFTVEVSNTGLPVVNIETPNAVAITSKDVWTESSSMRIDLADGTNSYSGSLSIRGRGNSTWGYPKKPFAIKLDEKAEILGMPKHKRWVLLANWMDRTLLRNHVAFKIAKSTDLEWTPNGQFVEVILNGAHLGNYYLCEQIKIDKNRVNVNEMKSTDVSGEDITGGYLMELDVNYDEVNKFRSTVFNLPFMMKEPDEDALNAEQFEYIRNYINNIEYELSLNDYSITRKYAEYIELNSFVDWWLVHELTLNGEPRHPKSSYMYKNKSSKIKAGPVWDFDWGTFGPVTGFCIKNAIWYGKLFSDPVYVQLVKDRWSILKPKFEQIDRFIEEEAIKIEKSAEVDSRMWPNNQNINGDEALTYEDAVQRMRNAYKIRLQWLDGAIMGL